MTHYEDLSPYEYVSDSVPDGVTAVNVGWLEAGREFPRGNVPEEFIETLSSVVKCDRQMKMRGWHRCRIPHINNEERYPVTAEIDGQKISLGGAEVRFISTSGEWMIAPDLILHYVTDHSYRPPAEFIEAVIRKRIAPSS
ncbi:hypothetical protein E0500_014935 [Streptomyces sp. KM273126]|uniref:DUF7919 family protein n=1 Tax=Streptomyces sp. KM273126 TaxID=2545247 RepID=UPI00103D7E53|nr:hypothetical protein [Streptomyces sp. KM273126]MBA2808657.1 hypothetical protein [Streptomyces sp. KM273126]